MSNRSCLDAFAAPRRGGFTLVEVLIASVVLVIALAGILGAAFSAMSKRDVPENVQGAIAAAQERLDYFRAQYNPYASVGGTYFWPPENKGDVDFSIAPAGSTCNLVYNDRPVLLVREYLYSTADRKYENGEIGQTKSASRSITDGTKSGTNEIPPTPTKLTDAGPPAGLVDIRAVLPNRDDVTMPTAAQYAAGPTAVYNNAVTGRTTRFTYSLAPRANDDLRAGSALPGSVKFVREVWIQTNNPNFATVNFPNLTVSLPATTADLYDQETALGNIVPPPNIGQNFLPPYVVAVTVKVYPRDKQTNRLRFGNITGVRDTAEPTEGPGYDRKRPLATTVGYFGLRRM